MTMPSVRNTIAGRHAEPTGAERFRAINPANLDDVIADYAFSSPADIDRAVAAARHAFPVWRGRTAAQRAEILMQAGAILQSRSAELGVLMTREMGKPLAEAVAEIGYAGRVLQFYASEAQRPIGEVLASGRPDVHYYTQREPIGAVGLITPWNFPFSIACWKIGPALITGNTAVWKPAPHHPFCSQALLDCLLRAGMPEGVVNLVHGGAETGAAIVGHAGLPAISFTGSTPVGQAIFRSVSHRLGRAQCEMGGKNGLYVHRSADLSRAVTLAVEGGFRSAGQKCTATSRVLVDRAILSDFTEMLVARVAELKLGDPSHAATFIGPVVDDRQFAKVRQHIEAAMAHGHRPAIGGLDKPIPGGYFIAPTIFTGVTPDEPLAQEEIFGPVVAVLPVDGLTEAIAVLNGTPYGLSSTIVTNDLVAAQRFARDIECGVVNVNLPTAGVEMHAPFGGWKGSGLGQPEQGLKIMEFYTHWRSIAMNFSS